MIHFIVSLWATEQNILLSSCGKLVNLNICYNGQCIAIVSEIQFIMIRD